LVPAALVLLDAPLATALSTASGQHVLRCVGSAMVACVDVGFARVYASVAVVASLAAAVRRLARNTWWWSGDASRLFTTVMMRVKTHPSLGRRRWRHWRHFLPEGDVEHLWLGHCSCLWTWTVSWASVSHVGCGGCKPNSSWASIDDVFGVLKAMSAFFDLEASFGVGGFRKGFRFFFLPFSLVLGCVVGCGGSCRCPNPTGQSSRRLWSRFQSDQAECRYWWLVSMSQSDRTESCGDSCRCPYPTVRSVSW